MLSLFLLSLCWRQVAGCSGGRALPARSSAAFWPARVPVCQIAALRSIHLIAALKAKGYTVEQL